MAPALAYYSALYRHGGEKALLSYNVSKAPELSNPLDRLLVDRLPWLPFESDVQRADAINMAGRFAQLLGDNSPEVVSRKGRELKTMSFWLGGEVKLGQCT